MAIFGSLDMSQNQIVNHLRAIESQPRHAHDGKLAETVSRSIAIVSREQYPQT